MSGQSHALLALVTRFRAEADKHEQLFQRQYGPDKDFSDEAYSKALNQAADELEAAIGLEVEGYPMRLVDGTWVERAVSVIGRFACSLAGDKDRFADYDECHLVMDALRAAPRVNPAGNGCQEDSLIERLLERAAAARREGNATAIGDAVHFEEAAAALAAHRPSERPGAKNG